VVYPAIAGAGGFRGRKGITPVPSAG
jgi:hypothetical protein